MLATFYEWRNWRPVKQKECVQVGGTTVGFLTLSWCYIIFVTFELRHPDFKKSPENVVKHLFTFPMESLIRSQSLPQTDSSFLSLLAPCLSTIFFPLPIQSSKSFPALSPIRFPSPCWWAIKDHSGAIYFWRNFWVLEILQNKTLPNKPFSVCLLILKSQSPTLDWFVSASRVN